METNVHQATLPEPRPKDAVSEHKKLQKKDRTQDESLVESSDNVLKQNSPKRKKNHASGLDGEKVIPMVVTESNNALTPMLETNVHTDFGTFSDFLLFCE